MACACVRPKWAIHSPAPGADPPGHQGVDHLGDQGLAHVDGRGPLPGPGPARAAGQRPRHPAGRAGRSGGSRLDVQDVGSRVGGGRVLVDPDRARVRGKVGGRPPDVRAGPGGIAGYLSACRQRSYVVVRGVEDQDRCHHEARLAQCTCRVPASFVRRFRLPCTWAPHVITLPGSDRDARRPARPGLAVTRPACWPASATRTGSRGWRRWTRWPGGKKPLGSIVRGPPGADPQLSITRTRLRSCIANGRPRLPAAAGRGATTERPRSIRVNGATPAARAVLPRSLRGGRGGEVEGGADAVLDEGAGQAAGDRVGGLPAGAVSGHDHAGGELLKSADGVPDDRLE